MKKLVAVCLIIIFAIFLINTFHEEYPDEYDSLVGGLYITQGHLPYKDWFQHHQPGAYVLASLIIPFSGQSFVKFRILLAAAFFAINTFGYFVFKSRMKNQSSDFYLLFLFFLAVGATYFWGHMLLADTLSIYLLLPAFTLLMAKSYKNERFEIQDAIVVSLFTFFAWFTSMTLMFVVAILNIYAFLLYTRSQKKENLRLHKSIFKLMLVFAAPYMIFGIYLMVAGSVKDYVFAAITYNQNYYIYNYPRAPGAPVNPIRYAVVIANSFFNNYLPALWGVRGIPLGDPLQVTLALSGAMLFLTFILKKRYSFLPVLVLVLIYSNARSNPQQIKETDYQAAAYLCLSLISGLFAFFELKALVDNGLSKLSERIIAGVGFLIMGLFLVFTFFYLFLKVENKFYPKYMGQAPFIYDYPEVAPMLNKLTDTNDYVWVGPFEFKELFYLTNKNRPTKYHWFLDHAARSKIKDEIIAELSVTKPKIIVFNRTFTPWGGDASTYNYFFTDFLDKNYFRIFTLNDTLSGHSYKWKISDTSHFNIDGEFNFDLSRKDEILQELVDKGYLEKVLTN